jgi:ribosome-associated toxin RatA of RatAB toxin-antitoxin module
MDETTRIFFICVAILLFVTGVQAKQNNDLYYKEFIIDAPISRIDALIHDYGSYHSYFDHMIGSNVIKKYNDNSSLCRFEMKVFGRTFWALVRMDRTQLDSSKIIYRVTTIDTNLKQLNGEWNLIRINDKQTILIFRGTALPHMILPKSLIRKILNIEITQAIKNINHLLGQLI